MVEISRYPGGTMAGNADARDGLALARQAYLFGIGNDGIPLRNRKRLLEISTVSENTLRAHVLTWEGEAENIARNRGESALGFCLREEVLLQHAEDVEFLRRSMNRVKDEVDNCDEIQLKLDSLIESIADNLSLGSDDYDSVSRLLENYFKHSMNTKSLLTLFVTLQKRWADSSAVSSTIDAYGTTLKENAKRQAKQKAEADGKTGELKPTTGSEIVASNAGVFRG